MAKEERKKLTRPTPRTNDNLSSKLVEEMVLVRKLLVLLLVKLGSDSKEIATALGVGESTIRTWLPMRAIGKLHFPQGEDE